MWDSFIPDEEGSTLFDNRTHGHSVLLLRTLQIVRYIRTYVGTYEGLNEYAKKALLRGTYVQYAQQSLASCNVSTSMASP